MQLKDLEAFQEIVIQCHDNPDADSIASGFALYRYFEDKGKQVSLIYGGRLKIQKSNLKLMAEILKIPIVHRDSLEPPELLITVDCQYGEGNVTGFEAREKAIIDHHQTSLTPGPLIEIQSRLGSCSTLVWKMLTEAGFSANEDKDVATALYYGLFTDTNSFTELSNPFDMDMRDSLDYNKSTISLLRNSNMSEGEVKIAGSAILHTKFISGYHSALVSAEPCDPNILGLISDLVLQVDTVETCVVFNLLAHGIKLSVRSCVKEVRANELAAFLTEGVGSGGGHIDKAGGFIEEGLLKEKAPDMGAAAYLEKRLKEYFESSRILYAGSTVLPMERMKKYRKKAVPVGYVPAAGLLPDGTPVTVRTLEGDLEIKIEPDIMIMIGIFGEVYPIKKEKFLRSYRVLGEPFSIEAEYLPHVINRIDGSTLELMPLAKACEPTGSVEIYAMPVDRIIKVFTAWDEENYMLGKPGDYLAVRSDDEHDIYIIEKRIFQITYALSPTD